MEHCNIPLLKPLTKASFGKLMKQLFPAINTRRLGGIHNSHYHYCGIEWIRDNTSQPDNIIKPDFPSYLASLKHSIPTLRRCPKGARQLVASAFTKAIEDILRDNSPTMWFRLMTLPYEILQLPPKKDNNTNLTTKIKDNVSRWINNNELEAQLNFNIRNQNVSNRIKKNTPHNTQVHGKTSGTIN